MQNTESQLTAIVKSSNLEVIDSKIILDKFGNYESIAREWETKAKMIKVTNALQITEMNMAREARKTFSNLRIDVEKTRKALKEQSLRKGQAIDAIARFLTSLISPIEQYLLEQENFVKIELERKAEEKRVEEARLAEKARIEQEAKEAAERERMRVENEKLRKEALVREKIIQAQKDAEEASKKVYEDSLRAEKEKAAAAERLAAEKLAEEKKRRDVAEAALRQAQEEEQGQLADKKRQLKKALTIVIEYVDGVRDGYSEICKHSKTAAGCAEEKVYMNVSNVLKVILKENE